MLTLWTTIVYNPIYNALIALSQYVTLRDVGLAVIVLTVLIRLALLPLTRRSVISQYKMRALEPKLAAIRAKGLSKQEESQETFALYRTEGINPFSGCLYLLLQLPLLLTINYVFQRGISQPAHLYSFLSTSGLHNSLLGLIDLAKPYLPLAVVVGVTQGIQAFLIPTPAVTPGKNDFQSSLTRSMSMQTRFVLPIVLIFVATRFTSAIALYWSVANLFSIGQELYFRKTVRLSSEPKQATLAQ